MKTTRRGFLKGMGYVLVAYAAPLPLMKDAYAAAGPGGDTGVKLVPGDRVESFIAVTAEGNVIGHNGHVDLGTGLRTAYAQIVAEELDVPLARVSMVLGDSDRTPNQGPTIASASIQTAAVPMRRAAAQARAYLVNAAATRWGVDAATLTVGDGQIRNPATGATLDYAELLEGRQVEMALDEDAPIKDPATYRIVGQSIPRVDIPAKVTGGDIYVHDVRLPDMLHARLIHPPYPGRDAGDFVGGVLRSYDADSLGDLKPAVRIVRLGDVLGVLAEREEDAILASRRLAVTWADVPALRDMSDLATVLDKNPDSLRELADEGDVQAALNGDGIIQRATYVWPYQMHGSIGPSCSVAHWEDDGVTIWTGSQNPHNLHEDLTKLLGLPPERIRLRRLEAAGCYGRNCADDVSAEAALLAREAGRPVRLQYMREDEHQWEPKGTAQLMQVHGGLTAAGTLAYDFRVSYPSNGAPLMASLYTGQADADPLVFEMGDRTAIPQYRVQDKRIVARDMPPIVRASWLRGVAALPNVFAHESFMDELAVAAGEDPIAFRLRFMEDPRPIALTKAVAERAGWQPRARPNPQARRADGLLAGRGFSQHQYVHGAFPGTGAAWCAWVADVLVDPATGYVRVERVTVAHDCGEMINPAGVRHQVHGNVVQTVSRSLKEHVHFDAHGVTDRSWGGYPILTFPEVPQIDAVLMPGNGNPPLGAGESASVPGPAAIANAIFDATGVRLREAPFLPERVKAGMDALQAQKNDQDQAGRTA
ncbi:xanthine dehydrogenase family protein molybdopterin-binding subunit [Achromobacter sp. GG226]|uniref:xanthine dehydrogenase family protein molybdopterin-binding subunit n=1 Tax=Verticiella alkaliphila TaxID=2779529 RepID=UPI001C0B44B5|nr:molybdopterin cofactor-binding domain-containing protein [Verticiella sp. GG226]MBU4609722.1 xanthine dehydrogenase family protein molybdopterin-binding subunit [Verticiella sp. GG226]